MTYTARLWFGPAERPLFGWVSAPDDLRCRAGVVLCLPVGEEVRTTHRAMRTLAAALAAAGFASIGFDYDGTGDSAGRLNDPDRPEAWTASVRAAATVLRDMGIKRLCAVGLRLGATILTRCADELDLDSVVLWDPCVTGRHFVREQQALHRTGAVQPPPREDDLVELPEYLLTAETAADIGAMRLVPTGRGRTPPERMLALTRPERPLPRDVRAWFDSRGAHLGPAPEQDEMLADYNGGYVPRSTVSYIVGWLDGVVPLDTRPISLPAARLAARFGSSPTVRETITAIGPVGLFGIVCEPDAAPALPGTVILIAASTEHHIGPARLWVELSRRWAERGIRTVRFDLSGIGFSPVRAGQLEHEPYASEWLDDLDQTVAAQAADGPVVLAGLCSGGYSALESGLELRVDAVCAINPILTSTAFHGKSTMIGPRRRVVRRMPWLLARLEPRFTGPVWAMWNTFTQLVPSRAPMAGVAQVARSGVRTLLVNCELDARAFQRTLYWRLVGEPRLRRTTGYRMVVVPESDHALRIASGRERVVEVVDDFVTGRFPLALSYHSQSKPISPGGPDPSQPRQGSTRSRTMQSDINRAAWSRAENVAEFHSEPSWTDEGERLAVAAVLDRLQRPRVLDLGVGTGRTAGLLAQHAAGYVGYDYSAAMVERARAAYPDLDIRVGDARNLTDMASASIDLTVFSFNGIDAVSHEDRRSVLDEMARVSRPGGLVLYSTLNLDGPLPDERPWWLYEHGGPPAPRAGTARYFQRIARSAIRHPRRYANWLRLRRFERGGSDWAVRVIGVHEFSILAHFSTPAAAVREARAAGFEVEFGYSTWGTRLDPARPDTTEEWIHLVARKPEG